MRYDTRTPLEAYFVATNRDGAVRIDGQPAIRLGYRIERGELPVAGNWVEWRWDGEALVVTGDRLGAFPLFYFASDDMVVVSPSIDRILATGVPRALDLDALAAFLALGYYLDDDTPFRDIRKLPAGGGLRWRPGQLTVTAGTMSFPVDEMDRRRVVDGIIDRVRAAVARSVSAMGDADFIMPVSGGRDSRHLLLELVRQGHPPRLCVTAGPYASIGGHEDGPVAARLCAMLGIEHRVLPVPPSLVTAEMRKNRVTSYGADQHSWSLAVSDAITGATPHTFEGSPGSSLLQRPWEQQPWGRQVAKGRVDRAARRLVRPDGRRDRYSDLVSPYLRKTVPPSRAIARVQASLEPHMQGPNPALSFRLRNRVVRSLILVPTLILGGIQTVFTPYMDPEFVAFGMSVPVGSVDRSVHDEAIATAFPDAADVPFAAFGVPMVSASFARRVSRDLAILLLRDSDGTLVDRRRLLSRTLRGTVQADRWVATGRRPALITYLVQLERLVREGSTPSR